MLIQKGKAEKAISKTPELSRFSENPIKTTLYDVFGDLENWQNNFFRFKDAEYQLGYYAMAYKHVVCNYFSSKHLSLLIARSLIGSRNSSDYNFVGWPRDFLAATESYCNLPPSNKRAGLFVRLVNFILSAIIIVSLLWWCLKHINWKNQKPNHIFFAADFISDTRDVALYRELEDGGPLLMVRRGTGFDSLFEQDLSRYTFCNLSDGWLDRADIINSISARILDLFRFYRYFSDMPPFLYFGLAKLAYKRLLYQGLFARFRPRFYWGRDPYNEDHIIRRKELNRVGGLSYGVNTGSLSWSVLEPSCRYISYDSYYIFGSGKDEQKYYGKTWANDMRVVPAGSFSANREHYYHRNDKRPNDIAVFSSVYIGEPEMVDLVRDLALSFPERTIYLNIKGNFMQYVSSQYYLKQCQNGPRNIKYVNDSVYDLFLKVTYGVSDPSSVVSEAIQFGVKAFCFDIPHVQKTNIFREYDGLTFSSGKKLVQMIRSLEQGLIDYPIENFRDIVDMSGVVFSDKIRADTGLSPIAAIRHDEDISNVS